MGIRAVNAALSRAGEIAGRVPNDLRLIFAFQQRALPEAHRLAENFGTVLGRIAIFDQAYFNVKY